MLPCVQNIHPYPPAWPTVSKKSAVDHHALHRWITYLNQTDHRAEPSSWEQFKPSSTTTKLDMFFGGGINVASPHWRHPLWRGNVIASQLARHLHLRKNFLWLTTTIWGCPKLYHRGRSSQKEILFPNKNSNFWCSCSQYTIIKEDTDWIVSSVYHCKMETIQRQTPDQ